MADSKISGLPASTTPLAGTEVLPIVQSGATKQVSIANVTAGRSVASLNLSTSGSTSTTPVLSFNASNCNIASGGTISGSYLQAVMQNKSGTAGASTNWAVSNDLGTDSTYYAEMGMNSSVFSASTPADYFSINNGIYFSGHDGDVSIGSGNGYKTYLAWGSTGQSAHVINTTGALGFSTNLGTTPAGSGTTGFGTSGHVLVSAGSAAAPAWSGTLTGLTSVATSGLITQQAGKSTPYNLISTGIPFVMVSSGTMGNNGALSGITAVSVAYPRAYVYLPINAISAGSAAGWYYAVFSATTAATVYNNVYTTGNPTVPASPTAFSTTGPGAYVQTTNLILGPQISFPANAVSTSANFQFVINTTNNNSVTTKITGARIGSTNIAQLNTTSGVNTGQMTYAFLQGTLTNIRSSAYINGIQVGNTTVDFGATQTIGGSLHLFASALDTVTLEQFSILVTP
jgi:hypothetical protein